MKLLITIARQNPNNVEEIVMEDVASYEEDDNRILVHFNNSPDETISLRGNDGVSAGEWTLVNITVVRKYLIIDMTQ